MGKTSYLSPLAYRAMIRFRAESFIIILYIYYIITLENASEKVEIIYTYNIEMQSKLILLKLYWKFEFYKILFTKKLFVC